MIDGISRDGGIPPKEDVYLCDKEVACMLKVSRRTLGEYRSNGTLPYYILGGKVLYKRSEIKQGLNRECRQDAGKRMKIIFPFLLRTCAGCRC